MIVLAGLIACASAPAGELQRQTLVLPIHLPPARGQDGPDLRCAVSFGPVVPICALAFSSDGNQLYSGGYREVLVWDLVEGKLARRIGVGQVDGPVRAVSLADDGRLLIVGEGLPGQSGAVRLFDPQAGKLIASFSGPRDAVQCLAVSPDGRFLVAGAAEPDVYVWSLKDRKLATRLAGHNGGTTAVSFSPDGKWLATGGNDAQLRIRETEGWKEDASLALPEPVTDLSFSPTGEIVAVAVAGPGEWAVRVHRVSDTMAKNTRIIYQGGAAPLRIAWSADKAAQAKRLYVACGDNTITALRGGGDPRPAAVMRGHADWVCGLAVSPDGTRIASGSLDGTVRLWNETDGRALATFVQLTPGTDEWLIVTPPGYLASSSAAAVKWRDKGMTKAETDLTARFNNPGLLRRVLAGERVAPPALTDKSADTDNPTINTDRPRRHGRPGGVNER